MKGLYVHLPFCRRRCSYCPFAISVDLRLRMRYFGALERELAAMTLRRELATLYFGGGTPSLSTRSELEHLLALVPVGPQTEVTFEANPEDIDRDVIGMWKDIGITRLSVGVQSLHDEELRPLGRLHGPERALESLRLAINGGFRTNADLIIGLPGQTAARFAESLGPVLDSGVGHVSLYVLDLDEDTPLRRRVEKGRTTLPHEDLVAELYLEAVERCQARGLAQYEVSNFARHGEESIHNLGYWTREPYLGVGLGAHSFDGTRRFANVTSIDEYLKRSEAGESTRGFEESIGPVEAAEEEIFLALRRREGIEIDRLTELRGKSSELWIERGLIAGALVQHESTVSFTPRGFLLSSELIADLF